MDVEGEESGRGWLVRKVTGRGPNEQARTSLGLHR